MVFTMKRMKILKEGGLLLDMACAGRTALFRIAAEGQLPDADRGSVVIEAPQTGKHPERMQRVMPGARVSSRAGNGVYHEAHEDPEGRRFTS
jgi:hypothetical protein